MHTNVRQDVSMICCRELPNISGRPMSVLTVSPKIHGRVVFILFIYLLLRQMADRHTVIQTRHSYTNFFYKQNNTEIRDSDHKFTDMVKEFQISSLLSCLTVSARAHCINYQQQQKPDAYDEIMTVEQLIRAVQFFHEACVWPRG